MKKNNILKKIILLVLITSPIIRLNSQELTQTIRGVVFDKTTEEPLVGANVFIENSKPLLGVATDENGNFRIQFVPVGRQTIIITFLGYNNRYIRNVNINSAKQIYLEIKLEEQVQKLDEIVVKAFSKNRPKNNMALISARSFTIDETERFAGSWGDPSRMVANYVGVVTVGDQRNDIIIRGNSPLGLLWRFEGVDIPNPNHYGTMGTTGGPISILNSNLLTNSDFYTGAFPAEFGNALSGVFDLSMRNGNNEIREHLIQMGFNGFELGTEGPISKKNKSSYIINYRYTMMELMDKLGLYDVGGIPIYQDISFKFNFPFTKFGSFSIFGIGGISEMDLNENLEENEFESLTTEVIPGTKVKYKSKMGVVALAHSIIINKKHNLKTSISISGNQSITDVDTIKDENNYTDFYNDNYKEINSSFYTSFKTKINAKNIIKTGISYKNYNLKYFDEYFESKYQKFLNLTDADDNIGLLKIYFQWVHKFTDKINLNNEITIEPRIGIKYNFNNKHSINMGYGLHNQMQPRINYFTKTVIDTLNEIYIETNRNLKFSKSHQFVLGYDFNITNNLRLKVETYYQHLYNIPVEKNSSSFSMLNYGAQFHNEKVDSLLNNGSGRNFGLELTFEKFLSDNYYFLLTTSLFESKYKGSDGIERNTAFNGNFVINLLGGFETEIGIDNFIGFDIKRNLL